MDAKQKLIEELRRHALIVGEVTLTSGATAQYYVDAKRAILRPAGFRALAELVAGYARRWEGPPLEEGERCLIVEDVVTSGGSTIQAIEAARAEGHDVCGIVAVLDRLAGGAEAIRRAAPGAPYEPLATIDDVYPDRPDREP